MAERMRNAMASLIELAREEQGLRDEDKRLRERLSEIGDRLKVIAALRDIDVGVDATRLSVAADVLRVIGCYAGGDDWSVIRDARAALVQGGDRLRKEYFGTKNYDRWFHQREDHPYGYGPCHGSIVFEVGLRDRDVTLTDEQVEAALYALDAIAQKKLTGAQLELISRSRKEGR